MVFYAVFQHFSHITVAAYIRLFMYFMSFNSTRQRLRSVLPNDAPTKAEWSYGARNRDLQITFPLDDKGFQRKKERKPRLCDSSIKL